MIKYAYSCLVAISLTMGQLPYGLAQGFKGEPIPTAILAAMKQGGTLRDNSPVTPERLRLLAVQHIDFEGHIKTGQIIVLDVCDEAVLSIFQALHERKFPIHKIQPMYHYQGSDHGAVSDNNTSCYVDRDVVGASGKKSLHAYGVAIDINPVQNPFILVDENTGTATYEPQAGIQYANRHGNRLGKEPRIGMAEEVVDLFAAHGFYWWGGYWDKPIDYQHFQLSKSLTELYLAMEPAKAKATFQKVTQYFNQYQRPIEQALMQALQSERHSNWSLADYYQKDRKLFDRVFQKLTQGIN